MDNFCAKDIKLVPITESATITKISDKEYFSSSYADFISNSKLGLINPAQGGSWDKFNGGFGNNIITSDSLIIGSAVHEQILQPELFAMCEDFDRPTSKLGYVADLCYEKSFEGEMVSDEVLSLMAQKCDYYKGDISKFKKFKQTIADYIKNRWEYEQKLPADVEGIYLHSKQLPTVKGCIDSLNNNPIVCDLLHPTDLAGQPLPSYNEHAIMMNLIAEFPDGSQEVLKLKAKLDNFTFDAFTGQVVINDVKTTSRFCADFKDGFNQFHYYREFGMYGLLLLNLLKNQEKSISNLTGNCLVVETTTSAHDSSVFQVTPEMFAKGLKEASYLLKLIAYYRHTGE